MLYPFSGMEFLPKRNWKSVNNVALSHFPLAPTILGAIDAKRFQTREVQPAVSQSDRIPLALRFS